MTTRNNEHKRRILTRSLIAGIAVLATSFSLAACSSDSKATDAAATAVASEGAVDTAAGDTATADAATAETAAGAAAETAAAASNAATPATGDATSAFPVTIAAANGSVTIKAQPTAIISLSPTATETLYAVGAGAQVKAVDDQSNFPTESASKKSKLSGFEPNVEASIASPSITM